MSDIIIKIRDGFQGEKMIVVPEAIVDKTLKQLPSEQLCVTQMGYFPRAKYHYRQRLKGCTDNILFYCIQGKGYYMVEGERFELQASHYAIIPRTTKQVRYWADKDDPWTIYWVHFTACDLSSFNNMLNIRAGRPVFIHDNDGGVGIWNSMYEIMSHGNSMDNLLNASMRLYTLLATFRFPNRQPPADSGCSENKIADRTIAYMDANIGRNINIGALAELNNLSQSYFSNLFRRSTGMSPIDYFIHIKMARACRLLCSGDLKINQIAAMLGYDDPYYFSRLFKKSMNVSPNGYRASVRDLNRSNHSGLNDNITR